MSGTVDMHMDLAVRFDYGEIVPWLTSTDGLIRMTAGPDAVALWHLVDPVGHDLHTVADFTVREGQRFPVHLRLVPLARGAAATARRLLRHQPDRRLLEGVGGPLHLRGPVPRRGGALAHHAEGADLRADRRHRGRGHDLAARGARRAAATGTTATAGCATPPSPSKSLMRGGYFDEAMAWRDWLLRAVAGDVSAPADHVRPGRRAPARRVGGLVASRATRTRRRCASATPPRGSSSSTSTARSCRRSTPRRDSEGVQSRAAWALQTQLVDFLETGWNEPDDGIWEVRGPRRHFTHSKVMAWVAVDRAVKTLEEWPELEGPLEEWRELRHEIFTEVCEKGYNEKVGAFTQYYGCDQLDASVLMIPLVGFLPAERPAGRQHGRGGREGTDRRRLRPALPHRRRRRGRRADRAARAPSWPARSGWSTACT